MNPKTLIIAHRHVHAKAAANKLKLSTADWKFVDAVHQLRGLRGYPGKIHVVDARYYSPSVCERELRSTLLELLAVQELSAERVALL